MTQRGTIVVIDFDGTIVEHAFPEVGEPMPHAIQVLRRMQSEGYRLVLNTCREDCAERAYLSEAVAFLARHGITMRSVNENHPEDDAWRDQSALRRKPYGHVYIDDRNFGGFPGWGFIHKILFDEEPSS